MVHLSGIGIIAMVAAGLCAGGINAVVGSGTLVTFPVLLAMGYPAVLANVSNTVGLVPGSAMGALGYRGHLGGQGARIARLTIGSVTGSVAGAILLLVLPGSTFDAVVPVLVGLGCLLVALGPSLNRMMAARHPRGRSDDRSPSRGGVSTGLLLGVTAVAVYGGYFGAAQGVLLIGLMGVLLDETMHRINATKNVLAGITNLVAGAIFVAVGDVAWVPAVAIAAGSTVGGYLGSRLGQRLHPNILRVVVVVIGVVRVHAKLDRA